MNKEFAEYLKSKQGLNRLLEKLRDKYISLGKYSGVVTLNNITEEESYDISNFLGRKVEVGKTLRVSYKEINKHLLQSKYCDFDWNELFLYYFHDKVLSNKEQKDKYEEEEKEFYQSIINDNRNSIYIGYIEKILLEKNDIYRNLKQRYNKDKDLLKKDLNNIIKLLDNIPSEPTNLAVFSSMVTGNPHYLDLNSVTSNMFLKFLSYVNGIEYPNDTMDKVNLLSEINIYTDPISNYVVTYNLIGNELLDIFTENNEILNLNLGNIIKMKKINTKSKKVYIFENPSILNSLSELDVPMIITSGIPNLALYKLLDKLSMSGNQLFYNGDFDPEGLLIANKLVSRYNNLKLFCYDEIDYSNCRSNEEISDSRLKKLDGVMLKQLTNIKQMLINNKKSAYQEKNLNNIKEFIIKNETRDKTQCH